MLARSTTREGGPRCSPRRSCAGSSTSTRRPPTSGVRRAARIPTSSITASRRDRARRAGRPSAVRRLPGSVLRLPRDDPRPDRRRRQGGHAKGVHGHPPGPFQGIPPTGRKVEIHVIDIVRVGGGRIVEHWNCVDRLGLLAQLGALPEAPRPRLREAAAGPSPGPRRRGRPRRARPRPRPGARRRSCGGRRGSGTAGRVLEEEVEVPRLHEQVGHELDREGDARLPQPRARPPARGPRGPARRPTPRPSPRGRCGRRRRARRG